MNVNSLEILDTAPVADLETLQVLVDGQRHRIVTLLMDEPLTAKEIADRLGIGRTRLYYHLDLLERHGIVKVSGTRLVSGIVERSYRAAARTFRVDRALLSSRASLADITDTQASILDAVAHDLHVRARARDASDEDLLVSRAFLTLSAERRQELRERLAALVAEYREADDGGDEIEVAVALFTTAGGAS